MAVRGANEIAQRAAMTGLGSLWWFCEPHHGRDPVMAKTNHITDALVLAGVDNSKNRHDVLIAVPGRTRRRRLKVLTTAEDDERLIGTLRSFGLPVTQSADH